MQETQNYKNHVRYYPLVHFVITPLLFLNLIWQIIRLARERSSDRAEFLFIAVVLLLISVAARLQALAAQDRVIRLEERLRYKEILPAELYEKSARLKRGEMLALRFASDEELPELIKRIINGEFKNTKEIKRAVKNWRADHFRV